MSSPGEVRRVKPRRVPAAKAEAPVVEIAFGRKNYIIFAVAAAVILAGYLALSKGSITIAPILLLTGYLVLIPWGILAK